MEARVELVRSGDRTRTSCTHEWTNWTCVGAANSLNNWASQTDSDWTDKVNENNTKLLWYIDNSMSSTTLSIWYDIMILNSIYCYFDISNLHYTHTTQSVDYQRTRLCLLITSGRVSVGWLIVSCCKQQAFKIRLARYMNKLYV